MAKVLISMPDEFLERIDDVANSEQRTRSELIREALRSYIRRNRGYNRELSEQRAQILEEMFE
ncbi:MAG: ribbon-helix-helix protein, CopG family [Candidatus Gastranaerophilales bacterium]|jgi:metal-responsive CopG/Arc/MetJ family transcriptional regulator|nr:ribbon-helix-helix protein, CopG family [Candidatus Gastranaerophilales bacterium]